MKKLFILLMFALPGITANAQGNDRETIIGECQRLYSDGEYATALTTLGKLDTSTLDPRTRQEVELLKALATVEEEPSLGRALLLQYLADYPESAKEELLACHIARSYYYTGNYEQACEWFGKCDKSRLTPQENDRATLYYALSLQECGKESAAKNLLQSLAVTSKEYADDAVFHLALIEYDKDNNDEAYRLFKQVELSDKYYLEVPYYLAGIYLKQGNVAQAKSIADLFIADHAGTAQGTKMLQIKGAVEYAQGNYSAAAESLSEYIEKCNAPQRIAKYQLALSLFQTGEYEKALEYFDACSDKEDAIAQNSLLHIGMIQQRNGNSNSARMAFEQAATMTYDDEVREKAMYNYALCLHQTRYSPFAESVKVFEQFLNDYPDSEYADQVGQYLVEVYMNTRNYDVALQSIEKIERPSADILEAKQKVLYRLGVQEFINGNMEGTIDFMNRSIELQRYNRATYADALLWRGEAQYSGGHYSEATDSYRGALAAGCNESGIALYGLGYSLFQNGKYSEAQAEFNKAINHIDNNELKADVYNRIADCRFYQRDYAAADSYYRKAVETDSNSGDYALLRSALTKGLSGNNREKVTVLGRLIENYPSSIYAEQAYYEMGRAYIEMTEYDKAIRTYDTFIGRYPESPLARRAAAEKAMIYNTTGNSAQAIAAYKKVIEQYPHSEEAATAAQDLMSIYVELGEVDKFVQYAASTPGLTAMNSSEIDTLTYQAAERFYNRGEFDAATGKFNSYLNDFPQGAFRLNCHYYLGAIYYGKGMSNKAIEHLEEVIEYPNSRFCEDAIVLAADIYFCEGNYRAAGELYRQMLAKSSSEERRQTARAGIMRSAVALGEHATVIEQANALVSSSTPELRREAQYSRAKANIATGNATNAVNDLESISSDTRTKEGAEAKYLLAQIMFDKGDYTGCESEIMEFIEMSTPHAYWLARSFVLLSDLYAAQGKTLEAKQYLQSLSNNYSGDDDIASMITERLGRLTSSN